MIPKKELLKFKDKIKNSARPVFLFDDDCDGVSSFIQYYHLNTEGRGFVVKGKPIVEERYASHVQDFSPDLVVILDKPLVSDEFLEKVKQEVLWLDHHPPQPQRNTYYLNPLSFGKKSKPTSYLVYKSLEDEPKKNIWLAMLGIVGDWDLSLAKEFRKQYPDLLPKEIKTPQDALFNSKIGFLAKIINFNLKGSTTEVMKSVKTLTRIKDPYEILDKTTSQGKFLYKKFDKINKVYELHKSNIKTDDSKFVVYKYHDDVSITSDLSNELLYTYPDKIIIVGREHDGKVMMSLRSATDVIVNNLNDTLTSFEGYGGGHELACGACVNLSDFDEFLKNFKSRF